MSIINNMPQKSGAGINGIIKQYYVYAGETINAGDFVEFVNGVATKTYEGTSMDTVLDTNSSNVSQRMAALQIDENRIFIVYGYSGLWGAVITVVNNNITIGEKITIDATSSMYDPSLLALSDGRIVVIWTHAAYYFYSGICTIQGTTVSFSKGFYSTTKYDATNPIRPVLLDDNTIFCSVPYDGTNVRYEYLHARILKISSTGAMTSYNTVVNTTRYAASYTAVGKLSSTEVFLYHTMYKSEEYIPYAMIFTIAGTTLSWGDDYQLSTVPSQGDANCIPIADKSFLIGVDSRIGIICSVENNIPKLEAIYSLFLLTIEATYGAPLCEIPGGNIVVTKGVAGADYTYTLYASILKKEGKILVWLGEKQVNLTAKTGMYTLPVGIANNKVLILHGDGSSSNYLNGQLYGLDYSTTDIFTNEIYNIQYETQVQPTITEVANGVAKSGGIGGTNTAHKDIIQIYVPNTTT